MGEISPDQLVAAVGGSEWRALRDVFPEMVKASDAAQSQSAQQDAQLPPLPIKACPHCHAEQEMDSDALLLRCPRCVRELAPDPSGSHWAHFVSSMRRYACFRGRATRKEYWSFILYSVLFSLPFNFALAVMNFSISNQLEAQDRSKASIELASIEYFAYPPFLELAAWQQFALTGSMLMSLLFLLPGMGLCVRRFHDVGWRGAIPVLAALLQQYSAWALIFPVIFIFHWGSYSLIASVINVFVLVVAFMDSKRGSNKFGPSSKYPR